jgi:hypothetical protein
MNAIQIIGLGLVIVPTAVMLFNAVYHLAKLFYKTDGWRGLIPLAMPILVAIGFFLLWTQRTSP